MKVIDLLNKMANDENYRPTVKLTGTTYTYDKIIRDYKNDKDSDYGLFADYIIENILNDEVEVIEEKKDIEEIEITEKDRRTIMDFVIKTAEKTNELVRIVNKLTKEREEK